MFATLFLLLNTEHILPIQTLPFGFQNTSQVAKIGLLKSQESLNLLLQYVKELK